MKGRFSNDLIIITVLAVVTGSVMLYRSYPFDKKKDPATISSTNKWKAPDINTLDHSETANLIRYGRELIANTAGYLGPLGSVAPVSNGMNCQNCHLNAGTRLYGSNFALVASTYPKYRNRSGRLESVEFRINECMERSLNGKKLDSLSREMQAMVAYLKWVGKDVPKGSRPEGTGIKELPWLNREANTKNGYSIYSNKCKTCHGENGEGQTAPDSIGYRYPPLWGENSYNVSAGLFRISLIAYFIKHNMPYKPIAAAPELTDEEAWDVAAFIVSMPRPQKKFPNDWPNISTKPVDYPFGPYTDSFPEQQHKFGPFDAIKKAKENAQKKVAVN
jgi:thiosulfate dehydrogenase